MTIHIRDGSLFDADVEAIVNPVNCVGVMGRGLAHEFKKRFRDNFNEYVAACMAKKITIGSVFATKAIKPTPGNPIYIINFPTKMHWRDDSHLDYIDNGLLALVEAIRTLKIKSIAIPALGCGLGKLNWENVRSLIIFHLSDLHEVDVWLYPPSNLNSTA